MRDQKIVRHLADVIAAIIVNRAIELAELPSPGEAFTTAREQWQPVRYSHTITTPNPRLTGFEIVVASSNNSAVENISTEIPGPKGIDGQWREAAATVDYFSQIAGDDAWAMVAARLGNRANRTAFTQGFWWNKESGMQNALQQPAPDWQGAVVSFRRALSRVQDLSAERSVVAHSCVRPGRELRLAVNRQIGDEAMLLFHGVNQEVAQCSPAAQDRPEQPVLAVVVLTEKGQHQPCVPLDPRRPSPVTSSDRTHDARQQRELPAQRLVYDNHLRGLGLTGRRPRIDVQVAVSLAGALSVPLILRTGRRERMSHTT